MARKIIREPYGVVFKDKSSFKDTYGGEAGFVFVECMRIRPETETASKTALVFSHPIGGLSFLPAMGALAEAGHHVICVNTRFRGNDTALTMEKCIVDLGAAIKDLKTRFGYERVVLGGWSGGGSLSLFYQEQAENPSVKYTPAGEPPDLTQEELQPAEGIMLMAAHVSRALTLTEWIDPSIEDESRPFKRNPELDLYNPENPNQPPYSEDFLSAYREAQIARNRRITNWAKDQLEDLKKLNWPKEQCFTVHGTMADPRWLDPAVDPNDREPGTCYLGDPKVVNESPVGLARFTTVRSWLSQWSFDETNANGIKNGGNISIPAIVIGNTADNACTPSHTHRLYESIPHEDKELHEIKGATHYYMGQADKLAEAVELCTAWLTKHGFWEPAPEV